MSELKIIRLYGHLRKFGKEFRMAVESPGEAVRALCAVVPGFREHMEKHRASPFRVLLGGSQEGIAAEDLNVGTKARVIKLVPVVGGAKSGWLNILIGAVLIAGAILLTPITGGSWLEFLPGLLNGFGGAMIYNGVTQLFAKHSEQEPSKNEERPFYAFNGPHLTTGQGNPVPVLLGGPLRIGGALISMGISAHQWPEGGFGAPDDKGTKGGDGNASPWVWAVGPVEEKK